jgi:hypothetical protein
MPITVRDNQKVWPTCPECGCRLNTDAFAFMAEWVGLSHFGTDKEKDARGCKCSLVNKWFWLPEESLSYLERG